MNINENQSISKLEQNVDNILIELGMNPYKKRDFLWLKEVIIQAVENPNNWSNGFLERIGRRENITRERVRQILYKATWNNWAPYSKTVIERYFDCEITLNFKYSKPNYMEFITLISNLLCKK